MPYLRGGTLAICLKSGYHWTHHSGLGVLAISCVFLRHTLTWSALFSAEKAFDSLHCSWCEDQKKSFAPDEEGPCTISHSFLTNHLIHKLPACHRLCRLPEQLSSLSCSSLTFPLSPNFRDEELHCSTYPRLHTACNLHPKIR